MESQWERMKKAIKQKVVPSILSYGFFGEYPNFYRFVGEERYDLLGFWLDTRHRELHVEASYIYLGDFEDSNLSSIILPVREDQYQVLEEHISHCDCSWTRLENRYSLKGYKEHVFFYTDVIRDGLRYFAVNKKELADLKPSLWKKQVLRDDGTLEEKMCSLMISQIPDALKWLSQQNRENCRKKDEPLRVKTTTSKKKIAALVDDFAKLNNASNSRVFPKLKELDAEMVFQVIEEKMEEEGFSSTFLALYGRLLFYHPLTSAIQYYVAHLPKEVHDLCLALIHLDKVILPAEIDPQPLINIVEGKNKDAKEKALSLLGNCENPKAKEFLMAYAKKEALEEQEITAALMGFSRLARQTDLDWIDSFPKTNSKMVLSALKRCRVLATMSKS